MNLLNEPDKIGSWDVHRNYEIGHNSASYLVSKDDGPTRLAKVYPSTAVPSRKNGLFLLDKLDHPNIIKMYDYDFDRDAPYAVTEWAEQGVILETMKHWHTEDTGYRIEQAFKTIFNTVGWLHSQGITHNLLTPGHILLSKDGTPKIGTFRNATLHDDCFFDTSKDMLMLAKVYHQANQIIANASKARTNKRMARNKEKFEAMNKVAPPKELAKK